MQSDSQHFTQLLNSEQELATHLHQLLSDEKTALQSNDLARLQQLQPQRDTAIEELARRAKSRLTWMDDHQLPHSSECLTHPLLQDQPAVANQWQTLAEQYQRNHSLSEQLAEVVLQLRKRKREQLKILRGQQNDPHLYNQNGNTLGLSSSASYIKA